MSHIWIGTRERMEWVKAPDVGQGATRSGSSSAMSFQGGGASVRRSKTTAKTFAMSWENKARAETQAIFDMADGTYGNGYIYYLNPFSANRNALPPYWAAPFMNYYDGPVIYDSKRPSLVNNGVSINGHAVESAVYELTSASRGPSVYLPIPQGYTAHIGAHGSVTTGAAAVTLKRFTTATASTSSSLTLIAPSSTSMFNQTVAGDTYSGIELSLTSASSGSLKLDGMIVQILLNGEAPTDTAFVGGQGQTGLRMNEYPALEEYSYAFDMVNVAADLTEVEAWEWR